MFTMAITEMAASQTGQLILASGSAGLAAALLSAWVLRSVGESVGVEIAHYEANRRRALRKSSWVYRTFESGARSLAMTLDANLDAADDRLQRALGSHPKWRPWKSREFLATQTIEGILVGGAVIALVSLTGVWQLALFLGIGLILAYPFLCRSSVLNHFASRLRRQRLRLPFVIDQIALMMRAGGGFEECLRTIAEEEPDHPLTEELRTMLAEIAAGRTRRSALQELKKRIPDAEVGELISSIVKGEELGTPLSSILSEQAEQMRIKRSQWGEKAAAEAEVQIVFPGMLVMIACLIVVLGPLLLPAVMNVIGVRD